MDERVPLRESPAERDESSTHARQWMVAAAVVWVAVLASAVLVSCVPTLAHAETKTVPLKSQQMAVPAKAGYAVLWGTDTYETPYGGVQIGSDAGTKGSVTFRDGDDAAWTIDVQIAADVRYVTTGTETATIPVPYYVKDRFTSNIPAAELDRSRVPGKAVNAVPGTAEKIGYTLLGVSFPAWFSASTYWMITAVLLIGIPIAAAVFVELWARKRRRHVPTL